MTQMAGVTDHFVRRAIERVRCNAKEAVELGKDLLDAIAKGRPDVEFVARVNTEGHRLFRFKTSDGRGFYALINTETKTCITVLSPGFRVPRQRGNSIKLAREWL